MLKNGRINRAKTEKDKVEKWRFPDTPASVPVTVHTGSDGPFSQTTSPRQDTRLVLLATQQERDVCLGIHENMNLAACVDEVRPGTTARPHHPCLNERPIR